LVRSVAISIPAIYTDHFTISTTYFVTDPKVAELMERGAIGVLAYEGGEVVGWAAVARRAETTFARNRKIPHVDDLDVWSVWCIRVRPGHRGEGISHPLLAGAVEFARSQGAPAIEGYPVDNRGEKVDLTMMSRQRSAFLLHGLGADSTGALPPRTDTVALGSSERINVRPTWLPGPTDAF
jgi:GNAT superfamily N-acetyltransferase